MVECATLSEGRGTTRPLELFGAPDIDAKAVIAEMQRLAPQWLGGCKLRDIWFQPTFHKHVGELNSGVHIHAEGIWYEHAAFQPWRSEEHTSELQALMRHTYAVFCMTKKTMPRQVKTHNKSKTQHTHD